MFSACCLYNLIFPGDILLLWFTFSNGKNSETLWVIISNEKPTCCLFKQLVHISHFNFKACLTTGYDPSLHDLDSFTEYYQPVASYFKLMPHKAIKVEILHPCAIFVSGLLENFKTVKANENQTIKLL